MSRRDTAFVRNAADPKQVGWAKRREEDRSAAIAAGLKAVLGTVDGRRVIGELIDLAGVYRTVYDHSGSTMYYQEGRRNFGLELMAMCIDADERLYEQMEREIRAARRAVAREAGAVQSSTAGNEG